MAKSIHLHLDETVFFMMKEDKAEKERKLKMQMTWEDYVALLFGMKKQVRK